MKPPITTTTLIVLCLSLSGCIDPRILSMGLSSIGDSWDNAVYNLSTLTDSRGLTYHNGLVYKTHDRSLYSGPFKAYGIRGDYQHGLKQGTWRLYDRAFFEYEQGQLQTHKAYYGPNRTESTNQRMVEGRLTEVTSGLPYTGAYTSVDAKGQYLNGLKHGVWLFHLPGALSPYPDREIRQYQQGQLVWRVNYVQQQWQSSERYEQGRVIEVYQPTLEGTGATRNGVPITADDPQQATEFKIDFPRKS